MQLTDMAQNDYFSVTILVLATFGVVVNMASIVILVMRKGVSQLFHHLLKILAIYDLVIEQLRSFLSTVLKQSRISRAHD
jgi:uncharacterized membrane protein YheB (UPF0754 family)